MHVLSADDASSLDRALDTLGAGGVVAHATETCYGLACDLRNPDAVRKLFDIKQRPYDQPMSALFPSIEAAQAVCEFSEKALILAKKHLPGPLTIILPVLKNSAPIFITADGKKASEIGIRISPHPIAMTLSQSFGSPIATTSANLHGRENPYSAEDIARQFKGRDSMPDLCLDNGTLPNTPPSTVVRVAGEEVTVVRRGADPPPSH